MRVLLVEDHPALREMMTDHLAQRGFAVDPVGCAADARAALDAVTYDLLILDLGLPDVDGMVILRETRARTAGGLPILLVTARNSLEDRLQGLNAGADDYILKPFDLLELEARLRAVLRRPGTRAPPNVRVGKLNFDPASRQASVNGVVLGWPVARPTCSSSCCAPVGGRWSRTRSRSVSTHPATPSLPTRSKR